MQICIRFLVDPRPYRLQLLIVALAQVVEGSLKFAKSTANEVA
jgi:hypothetical protein